MNSATALMTPTNHDDLNFVWGAFWVEVLRLNRGSGLTALNTSAPTLKVSCFWMRQWRHALSWVDLLASEQQGAVACLPRRRHLHRDLHGIRFEFVSYERCYVLLMEDVIRDRPMLKQQT